MNILVAKNGSQLGPFNEADLRAKLASGEFSPADLGWREGMPAWAPLSEMLGSAPTTPAAPPAPAPAPAPQPPAYAPQPYAAPQGQGAAQPYNSPYPAQYQQGMTQPWGAQGAGNYAGFWLRFVAIIIDAIVLSIPVYIVAYVLAAAGMDIYTVGFLVRIFNIILGWLYFAYMESSPSQGTLGKLALGLKVTDENGNKIGFGQATGRHFGKIVSALILLVGFIMAGFTQRKQALHDLMAHTLVVRK